MGLIAVIASAVAWLTVFVIIRGRGSAHRRALACFESLIWTLILAIASEALLPPNEQRQMLTLAFFIGYEVLGGLAACVFLFLADPDPGPETQGTGLSPLKGE